MTRGLTAYNEVYMNTNTNKVAILLDLYEGAIRFIDLAEKATESREFAEKGKLISRAVSILTELDNSLDRHAGGSIAENLSSLYSYMVQRLTFAHRSKDSSALREVRSLMEGLLDAWKKAAQEIEEKVRISNESQVPGDLNTQLRRYCIA